MKIDWGGLAEELGTVTRTDGGFSERGGTEIACKALTGVIGDEALRDAVDFYTHRRPGSELVRSVLWLLSPPAAMERCLELFREPDHPDTAASAIELLKVIADRRALAWVPEFLASDNVMVRCWTMGLIDQLLIMKEDISEVEAMPFIEQGLQDVEESVRSRAVQIIEMLAHDAVVDAARQSQPA